MATAAGPTTPGALSASTMCEALLITLSERGDAVALRTPDDASSLTYAQLDERLRRVASGLAELGVGPGDAVGLMMTNRPEFNVVDAAAMARSAAAIGRL